MGRPRGWAAVRPQAVAATPGTFSTSVVVVRDPPTKIELAKSSGLSWARAV